jgi:hypothetical protein
MLCHQNVHCSAFKGPGMAVSGEVSTPLVGNSTLIPPLIADSYQASFAKPCL